MSDLKSSSKLEPAAPEGLPPLLLETPAIFPPPNPLKEYPDVASVVIWLEFAIGFDRFARLSGCLFSIEG